MSILVTVIMYAAFCQILQ